MVYEGLGVGGEGEADEGLFGSCSHYGVGFWGLAVGVVVGCCWCH